MIENPCKANIGGLLLTSIIEKHYLFKEGALIATTVKNAIINC